MNPSDAEIGVQVEDRELSQDEVTENSAKLVTKLNQLLPQIPGFNEALYKSFLNGNKGVVLEGNGSRFTIARVVDKKLLEEGFTGEGWDINVRDVNPSIKGAEGLHVYSRISPSEIVDEHSAQRGGQSEIDYKNGKTNEGFKNVSGAVIRAEQIVNKLATLTSPTPTAQRAA